MAKETVQAVLCRFNADKSDIDKTVLGTTQAKGNLQPFLEHHAQKQWGGKQWRDWAIVGDQTIYKGHAVNRQNNEHEGETIILW